MTDWIKEAYQQWGALLLGDTHFLHFEPKNWVFLDGGAGRRIIGIHESLSRRLELHIIGDLAMRNEGIAGSNFHSDTDSLHTSDYSVQNLPFERSVDQCFESNIEDSISVVVDQSFFYTFQSNKLILLENGD